MMSRCIARNVFTGETVEVRFAERIESVSPAASNSGADSELWISPAWVDVQVNGFLGVDYCSPETPHEEIARSIEFLYSTGVARFYPTVITGAQADMTGALRNLARAKAALPEGEAMDGFHVEGPFISPDDGPRGAHPLSRVRPPSWTEFEEFQDAAEGNVRLLTLAPEWPGSPAFIEKVVDSGVVVSLGHTNASAENITDAVQAGATMSTHLGNGAHAVMRRHPNYIWEQMANDDLYASFIADGIHLPASFLKVGLRAKGLAKSVLVTDASAPAGCKPGRYRLGEQEVDLTEDNRVVLAGKDKLAGSALRMDDGVSNLMKFGGASLAMAATMATVNAARAGNVPLRKEGLIAGERADLVLFRVNGKVRVLETFVGGRSVFRA